MEIFSTESFSKCLPPWKSKTIKPFKIKLFFSQMRSHFWFPQLWCSLSLPTIKQVLLFLLCSILMLFPSVPGLPFPLHCLISASCHIVSIPADPAISQALSHPTHHAHNSRITHVKYALVLSLSKSTVHCVPFTVRIKSDLQGFHTQVSWSPSQLCIPLLPHEPSFWPHRECSELCTPRFCSLPRPEKKLKREKDRIWGERSLQTPRS